MSVALAAAAWVAVALATLWAAGVAGYLLAWVMDDDGGDDDG